jgi:hypothetical protein
MAWTRAGTRIISTGCANISAKSCNTALLSAAPFKAAIGIDHGNCKKKGGAMLRSSGIALAGYAAAG